jgi:hypothetical protein
MYPYDYFKNRPLAENLVKRDSWILKNCPVEGNEEFIKSTVAQNNVCLGKNASQLISFLGDRILFVCPPSEARNPDGTCITGLVPYKIEEGTNNNHSRNEWIIKYCPK